MTLGSQMIIGEGDKMKKAIRVIGLAALFCMSTYASASCSAYAKSNGTTTDGNEAYPTFTVTGKPCSKGCRGYVEYSIIYKNMRGTNLTERGMISWDSEGGEPVEVTDRANFTLCSRGDSCQVIATKINDTSCYN